MTAAPRSFPRRVLDLLAGKIATLVLAASALALAMGTFVLLSGGASLSLQPNLLFGLVLANLVVLLLLGAVLAGRLTRVLMERRRGLAGSRLHVRLVMLFSGVAVTPTIVVAVFATAFFNLGIQGWFNDRVRTALTEGLEASRGYLEEHRNTIRTDALAMAYSLSQADRLLDRLGFSQELQTQTLLRGLTEAVVFDSATGVLEAGFSAVAGTDVELPPFEATELARGGEVAVLGSPNSQRVQALSG